MKCSIIIQRSTSTDIKKARFFYDQAYELMMLTVPVSYKTKGTWFLNPPVNAGFFDFKISMK